MQISPEVSDSIHWKMKNELTRFIYRNLIITIPLLACLAAMLVFKLNGHVGTVSLVSWLTAFLAVTACQGALARWYNKTKDSLKWENLYYKLLIVDVGIVGALWGTAGVLFMPQDTLGQSYLIFILAFVAAGGPLYLTKSGLAGAVYATGILAPLIGSLIFSFFSQPHHEIYFNVTLALACYWSLLMVMSYYGSKLFAENFTYNLVNQALADDLSQTTEELAKMNAASRTARENLFLSSIDDLDIHKTLGYKLEHTDALTGADTQEVAGIKFAHSRAYARRHHESLAVLSIHINNYHEVKTTLGEKISNLLLKTAAVRLLYCKRDTDILYRLDENKFILVVSEILLGHEIMTVVNKIIKTFAEKTIINDNKVQINASIGISVYPKDGDDLSDLIERSEIALSHLTADNTPGKTSYIVYDPGNMEKNMATDHAPTTL